MSSISDVPATTIDDALSNPNQGHPPPSSNAKPRSSASGVTIGELARRAGVGVETVRYYQRRGLFPEPPRKGRETREYDQEALDLLRFIRRARGLNFTIREIERLVVLRKAPSNAPDLLKLINDKTAELEQRIHELKEVIATLRSLGDNCAVPGKDFHGFDAG